MPPIGKSKAPAKAAPKASKAPAKTATTSRPKTQNSQPAAAKPTTPKDTVAAPGKEAKSQDPAKFSSFLDNVKGAFGQLGAGTSPLDFSPEQKQEGIKAAGTMGRLAGPDGTWDKNDLANNLAQLQTSGGIKGRIEGVVARNKLFDTHKVPEADREGIANQAQDIKKQNPNIANLHKLESMDPEKITDPAKRAKYDELKEQWTSELSEKGLMPVGIPALQQMGDASEVLQGKLKEQGLPVPEGKPVNVDQFQGLFEGKSPLRTAIGL